MTSFGNRLKLFRQDQHLSQEEMAELCGPSVSQGNITQWEKDRNKPSGEKWDALIRAFPQLNTEWLLKGTGKMILSPKKEKPDESVLEQQLKEKDKQIQELQAEIIQLLKEKRG